MLEVDIVVDDDVDVDVDVVALVEDVVELALL